MYPERGCGCGTDGSTSAAGTALNGGWTMKFHVLTLFPDMVMQGLMTSITGRAVQQKKIDIDAVNIRCVPVLQTPRSSQAGSVRNTPE